VARGRPGTHQAGKQDPARALTTTPVSRRGLWRSAPLSAAARAYCRRTRLLPSWGGGLAASPRTRHRIPRQWRRCLRLRELETGADAQTKTVGERPPMTLLRRELYPALERAGSSGPGRHLRSAPSTVFDTPSPNAPGNRRAGHVIVTSSRPLLVEGDDGYLRAVGAGRAEDPGGQDGRRVDRLSRPAGEWNSIAHAAFRWVAAETACCSHFGDGPCWDRTSDLGIKSLGATPAASSCERKQPANRASHNCRQRRSIAICRAEAVLRTVLHREESRLCRSAS
jgi:hypothetical protein